MECWWYKTTYSALVYFIDRSLLNNQCFMEYSKVCIVSYSSPQQNIDMISPSDYPIRVSNSLKGARVHQKHRDNRCIQVYRPPGSTPKTKDAICPARARDRGACATHSQSARKTPILPIQLRVNKKADAHS